MFDFKKKIQQLLCSHVYEAKMFKNIKSGSGFEIKYKCIKCGKEFTKVGIN